MKQNETLLCELARAAKMGKDSVSMLMKKTDDAPRAYARNVGIRRVRGQGEAHAL